MIDVNKKWLMWKFYFVVDCFICIIIKNDWCDIKSVKKLECFFLEKPHVAWHCSHMHLIFYYFFLLFLTLSKLLVLSLCAFSCLLFGVLSLSVMFGGWEWWRPRRGPPTSNRSASTKLRFPNPAPPAATIKAQQAKKPVANTTNAALHCARKPLPHKLEQNPYMGHCVHLRQELRPPCGPRWPDPIDQ
jgi:hypothetical protein